LKTLKYFGTDNINCIVDKRRNITSTYYG